MTKKRKKLTSFLLLVLGIFFLVIPGKAQAIPEIANDISPLLIGERAADVTLKNWEGKDVSLMQIISEKPTVLIFYRGGWCPYCNTHLAELQEIEGEILLLGFQIVAISPDSPMNLGATIDKHDLNYVLLSDSKSELAKEFGIAFKAPQSSLNKIMNYSEGINKDLLPVPSVFVLNQEGEILFEYINPNYKKRIKSKLLLSVLEGLAQ